MTVESRNTQLIPHETAVPTIERAKLRLVHPIDCNQHRLFSTWDSWLSMQEYCTNFPRALLALESGLDNRGSGLVSARASCGCNSTTVEKGVFIYIGIREEDREVPSAFPGI
jgi:hypothetical protein